MLTYLSTRETFGAMAANPLLSARVDPSIVERVDRIVAALNARRDAGAREIERSDVVRRLLARALPGMEAELEIATPPATKASKGQKGGKKPPRKA